MYIDCYRLVQICSQVCTFYCVLRFMIWPPKSNLWSRPCSLQPTTKMFNNKYPTFDGRKHEKDKH